MEEIWKDCLRHDDLQVSDCGNVRTMWVWCNRGGDGNNSYWFWSGVWRVLPVRTNGDGYLFVIFRRKKLIVHHLMLEAFVSARPTINGERAGGRHLNDVKTDNRLNNLSWGTQLDNRRDSVRNGTHIHGERQHMAKLTDALVVKIRKDYATGKYLQKELAEKHKVSRTVICVVIKGGTWKHLPTSELPPKGATTAKKKLLRGEDCSFAKLTEKEVREMRRLWATGKYLQKELAKMFKVSVMSASMIVRGKHWKHVK